MPRKRKTERKEVEEKKRPEKRAAKKDKGSTLNQQLVAVGIVGLILGIVIGLVVSGGAGTKATAAYLTPQEAGQKLVDWIKAYFDARGVSADVKLNGVKEVSGVYEVNVTLTVNGQSQTATYMVSKDGKFFFTGAIDISTLPQKQESKLEKRDRPDVKLFVMSYCPYGVQMEKALIPVLKLLGDKVDFSLHFVNYAMHGEKEVWENVRQYCIQKEYGTQKLLDYLECFDTSTNPDANACMEQVGIDVNRIDTCIDQTNQEYNIAGILSNKNLWYSGRFPPFPIDDALNQKYGVRGSPTLVINDTVVNAARNPEALKQLICSAFTNPPEECNQTLSTETPQPGFGGGTGSSNTNAQCG